MSTVVVLLHNNSQPARAGYATVIVNFMNYYHELQLSTGLRLWNKGFEAFRGITEAVFPAIRVSVGNTDSVTHKTSKVNSLFESFLNLLTITELRLLCKVQRFNGAFLCESVAGGHNYGDFVSDSLYLYATDGIFGLIDPAMEGILLEYGVESLSGSRYEVQMLEMCMYLFIYLCTISRRVPAPPIRNVVFLLSKCNMTQHLLLISYPLMEMFYSLYLYTLSMSICLSYLIAILMLCEAKGISILRGFLIYIHGLFMVFLILRH